MTGDAVRHASPAAAAPEDVKPPRKVMAILACHGRSATTQRALRRLFAQDLPPGLCIEATLVDDGSPDDTAAMVSREFPQVRLHRGDGSLWWAGAMIIGLEAASREQPDFLLWLNDDVQLDADAVRNLVSCHDEIHSANGGRPIIVGATRDPVTRGLTYGGQKRVAGGAFRFASVPPSSEAQPCGTFQGNIVLVPLQVHRLLDGIDRRFMGVQGMADTDFGLRAVKHGIAIIQAPGMIGCCPANQRPFPWSEPGLSRAARLKGLVGPRGFPLRGWLAFARNHGGALWPLWAAAPYLRRLWPALRPQMTKDCKKVEKHGPDKAAYLGSVALMDGLIPSYRLPVLAGMARKPQWDVTAFHGPVPHNFRATATTAPLPLKTRQVRHRTWPGGKRMAWTGGVGEALGGRYDIVVMEFSVHNLGIWTVWLARQVLGRPRLVLSGHFRLDRRERSVLGALRHRLRLVLARGADALLPYTDKGRDYCIASGLDTNAIFVSHNTMDVRAARDAAARVAPATLATLRSRLTLSDDASVFLFVGRLYAEKRVDLAIEAVEILRRQGRDAVLVIVGDGPEGANLAQRASGLAGIRLLPGETDENCLAPLFALASAVVCPGAVGLIVTHAFAHSKPLVTCEGDQHGVEIDYLRPDENGVITKADAPHLASALNALLADPVRLDRLAQGARQTAEKLSIESVVEGFLAAWKHAMDTMPAKTKSQ